MEVKIGVAESPRELIVSSAQSADEVEALVADALKDAKSTLRLVDEKGRKVLVPSARLAYVEIAPSDTRNFGFSVGS
ncbi:MAG: DUF3107 domain-containing protein [Sciscionella sp.]